MKLNNNQLYVFAILFLLLLNLFNLLRISFIRKELHTAEILSIEQQNSDSVSIANLSNNLILTSVNSNFKISPFMQIFEENGKEHLLSDLCNGGYMVVFRYNEFSCSNCIHKEMGNLKILSETIGKDNILILAAYENIRDFYINKRVNDIDLPIYNVPLGAFDNTIEDYNIPYLFLIDENYTVSNLFIPVSTMPEQTEKYFKIILTYF